MIKINRGLRVSIYFFKTLVKRIEKRSIDKNFILKKVREFEILKALEAPTKYIYPVYQPKLFLLENKIIGAEVLARLYSKELGEVQPNEFIEIAEKNKVIYKVDYTIIEASMNYLKNKINEKKILDDFKLSFNLSIQTLERQDFLEVIESLLKKTGVRPQNLEIEITESILIKDIQQVILKLEHLKKIGFIISLDDFTVGNSTASILQLLPLDIIKFDKTLLDSVSKNEKAKKIYRILVRLVKELQMEIVAEGVETLDQFQYLESLSIDWIQGYFISKPVSEDELDFVISNYGGKSGYIRKG